MSVTRMERAGETGLTEQQTSGSYLGYLLATCHNIRGLRWEDQQSFAVYDTALVTNISHADVCQAVFRPRSKQSEMRRQLQALFIAGPIRVTDAAADHRRP